MYVAGGEEIFGVASGAAGGIGVYVKVGPTICDGSSARYIQHNDLPTRPYHSATTVRLDVSTIRKMQALEPQRFKTMVFPTLQSTEIWRFEYEYKPSFTFCLLPSQKALSIERA